MCYNGCSPKKRVLEKFVNVNIFILFNNSELVHIFSPLASPCGLVWYCRLTCAYVSKLLCV